MTGRKKRRINLAPTIERFGVPGFIFEANGDMADPRVDSIQREMDFLLNEFSNRVRVFDVLGDDFNLHNGLPG